MSCVKRQKLEHESASCSSTSNFVCDTFQQNLLNFSDDVLLNIFSNLRAADLHSLSQTCERLHNLCQDRTLWDVADFRGRRMRTAELSSILPMLQAHTNFLAVRGFADMTSHREAGIMPVDFLRQLSTLCPGLETILVEDFYIDVETVDCRDFPSTVKCLSMKGCQVMDSAKVRCLASEKSHFFLQVYVHLPNLETLVLSYCRWFRLHSLMAISKCPNLVELRLDGIRHLHDNVPYLSLATSFGFRKLKILDMRNTTVGSSAMRGFNNLLSLTHLYLECPPQYRRKEASDPAAPVPCNSQHCPESSDEECDEVNVMKGHENSCVIVLRFGGEPEVWHSNACTTGSCSSRKEKRVLHFMRNEDQGEGTSRQDSGSVSENSTNHKKDDQATSSNGEKSAGVSGNVFQLSIDASSASEKSSGVVENAEVVDDDVIYIPKCGSEDCTRNHCVRSAFKMDIEIKTLRAESRSSTAETNTGTRMLIGENKDVNAEKNRNVTMEKNRDVIAEKNTDGIAEKNRDDVAEKNGDDVAEKNGDDVAEKNGDDVAEKNGDDVAEKNGDDVAEKNGDDVAEKNGDDVAEKNGDDVAEKSRNVIAERNRDDVAGKNGDDVAVKSRNVIAERNRDDVAKKTRDNITQKTRDVITGKNRDVYAEKLIGNGELSSIQNEQPQCSSCGDLGVEEGSSSSKKVDKSVEADTEHERPGSMCAVEHNTEGSESSDSGSSDDEGSAESDCHQPGCNDKPGKRHGGRLHSVELFSSARNAKCSRSSCLSGRHEELIDDVSIDYFLSRDMWRVSLDGNIVRCNDRSPRLHTLVMRFYPHVTDKTLNLLRRISSLRYVDVTGTRVTEKGVESLRLRRPDVTVVSDFGEPK